MSSNIRYEDAPPPVDVFIEMRAQCGWGRVSQAMTERSLAAGVLSTTLYRGEDVIGFVRVVGDGALYYYIQDLIVAEAHRGQGYGRGLMDHILRQLEDVTPSGAMIGLMSAVGKEAFYESFGFIRRPNADFGAGMIKVIE